MKKRRVLNILISMSFLCLSTNCKLFDKDEEAPSYIYIKEISLITTPSIEGTNSHKIVDAWLFVDGSILGVFELPVTVPILKAGSSQLNIIAGVLNNGISTTRVKYPFYNSYSINVDLKKLKVDTISPSITYTDSSIIKFAWIENFEIGNSLEKFIGDTVLNRVDSISHDVFEDRFAGLIQLTNTQISTEIISIDKFTVDNNRDVYLELNYKCNQEFDIGIQIITTSDILNIYKITVNPKTEYNKIYIDFTNEVADPLSVSFKILFRVRKSESTNPAKIYLDNLKLVHFIK